MRLDKYLAEAGIGMRKEVRGYIKNGDVLVNGNIVLEPSTEIDMNFDEMYYKEKLVEHKGKVYYMFHKPAGCVTARKDENKPTVLDYFSNENCNGLFPVGRLDMDTEGLLFLTNDGSFDHMLMYPKKHVDKTYFFWAFGELTIEEIKKIETGIDITGDENLTKPAILKIEKAGMFETLRREMDIEDFLHKKKNLYNQKVISGYLTITEGRKHQVKRMLKAMGCYVVYLKRISIGPIELDETLEKGQYRVLSEQELQLLTQESQV